MTMGYAAIEGSPFILVALNKREASFKHWLYQQSDVILFLLASVATILVVVSFRFPYADRRFDVVKSNVSKYV